MKRRIFTVANFLGFNVVFFGLYLSFIHTDKPLTEAARPTPAAAAFSETFLVEKTEKAFPATFPDKKKQVNLFHK